MNFFSYLILLKIILGKINCLFLGDWSRNEFKDYLMKMALLSGKISVKSSCINPTASTIMFMLTSFNTVVYVL